MINEKQLKQYDEITKTGNKNTIRYESTQGQILEKFKDTKGFVENVRCSWSTIYFKIGFYKFLKKYQDPKNVSLSSYSFRNNFKWLKQFVKATKNYSHRRRTVQMVLLITIVFIHFPRFVVRLSTRLFFCSETFYFPMKLLFPGETFFFSREFLFFPETFSFWVRLFLFWWKFFSWKLFYTKWKFLVNHKRTMLQAT